jgi:hypothetical protein
LIFGRCDPSPAWKIILSIWWRADETPDESAIC